MAMEIELDHVFVCAAQGAPEGDLLLQLGFVEGSPNVHQGQGTSNRRFPFRNAMVELMWVSDPVEAKSELTRETNLWERWSQRASGASPFGICTRPIMPGTKGSPFAGWEYKPSYLPPDLCLHVGAAPIEEPMWVHLDFVDREHRLRNFVQQPNGATDITGLRLTTPVMPRSEAARVMLENHVLEVEEGSGDLLEIEVDHRRQQTMTDLRPALPIVFHL
jgi:hypothetical protein